MIYLLMSVVLVAYLLDCLHALRISDKAIRHRYRLYELRDALREAAITGRINPRSWVFQYLDSSISKTIDQLPRISLWQSLGVWLTYRRDPRVEEAAESLNEELQREENNFYRQMYVLYGAMIITYLMDRHIVLRLALRNGVQRSLQAAARVQRVAPATSTLMEYA
jgi:hypothetical protein